MPDTKDWTWVIDSRCPECGFDAGATPPTSVAALIRENAELWPEVLGRPDVAQRPTPSVWSPLEYACHVRDVHRVFLERVQSMLDQDAPEFANWDQDVAALEGDYAGRSPAVVAGELSAFADAVATAYDEVPDHSDGDAAWQRSGLRSNGSAFTLATIAVYHLHDVVHHAWDVSATLSATVASPGTSMPGTQDPQA